MSRFLEAIKDKAKKLNRHIILVESGDERVAKAAEMCTAQGIARITLIGEERELKAKFPHIDFSGVAFENPKTSKNLQKYTDLLFNLRKSKGMTPEAAAEIALDPLYFANLMLKSGDADGIVAGAVYSTESVLRPSLQIIKTSPGIKTASSCFLMVLPEGGKEAGLYGEGGALIFGDSGMVTNPTAEQLVDITYACVDSQRSLVGGESKVGLLSFSTKGSGKDPIVDKVIDACNLLKSRNPDFLFDGELQGDAALVPSVAAQKAPGSPIGGKANILIFPDLNCGNIAYKLVQRLAGAEAIGPIIQGLDKPVNDLSRGCNSEDIVVSAAIVALKVRA